MAGRFNPVRLLRFSLATLLFTMLCVACYFGSHRAGQLAGEKDQYDESYFVKIYSIADLMVEQDSEAGRAELFAEIDKLLRAIAPETWGQDSQGDERGDVQPILSSGAIFVSQHGAVHRRVEAALNEFRDLRMHVQIEKWQQTLQELCSKEQTEKVVLSSFSTTDPIAPLVLGATEQRFEHLVQNLTKRWGGPQFRGDCIDRGFPVSSLAQSIATWPRNGGVAYVAVEDWPEMGRVVLAGWRPKD